MLTRRESCAGLRGGRGQSGVSLSYFKYNLILTDGRVLSILVELAGAIATLVVPLDASPITKIVLEYLSSAKEGRRFSLW